MGYFIACVSWGKDSLAMLLRLIAEKAPLNEVVFFNNGMDFKAIYAVRDNMIPVLEEAGIKYTELTPKDPFLWSMLERPVESKEKGKHFGYGWCGGRCRWGTSEKNKAMDNYAEKLGAQVYIGIAADELPRLQKEKKGYKIHPLADWGMAEADCLEYCYYYIAAARWLWENRSWANIRQKWKAFDRAMRKYETPAQRAEREYRDYWERGDGFLK